MKRKTLLAALVALLLMGLYGSATAWSKYNSNWDWEFMDDERTLAWISYRGSSSHVTIPHHLALSDRSVPVRRVTLGVSDDEGRASYISSISFSLDADGGTPVRDLYGPGSGKSTMSTLSFPEGVQFVNGFGGNPNLTNVNLPSTCTSLGGGVADYGCFSNCTSLQTINLENVRTFGAYSLQNTGLTEVAFSEGTTEISASLFCDCRNLRSVQIPESVRQISHNAFQGCTDLTDVTIVEGVTTIQSHVFEGCTSLKELYMPDTVTSLGSHAFNGCTELESIHLSESLQAINPITFVGCSSLEYLYLPASLTDVSDNACPPALKKLVVADGIGLTKLLWGHTEEIEELYLPVEIKGPYGAEAHSYPKLKKATVSRTNLLKNCQDTLEELVLLDPEFTGNSLQNYHVLHSVTLPEGLTVLPASAFKNCTALTDINLPDSLTAIGPYAFSGCPIPSVQIPEGVSAIDYVFEYNPALESITLPNTVKSMEGAFRGCTALKTVNMPWEETSVTSLKYSFQDCTALERIWINPYITNLHCAFSGCTSLVDVNPSEEGPAMTDTQYAFENCTSLRDFWLLEGKFSRVDYRMFAGSGLQAIDIPESVTAVSSEAFRGCENLSWVRIPENHTMEIDQQAFADCPMLGSVNIPDQVTVAGNSFENDWVELIVTQGSSAWSVARSSPDDGIRPRFRDQLELAEGAITGMEADGDNIVIYGPPVVPDGEYYYYYLLESSDGSYSQWISGKNRGNATFTGLDLNNQIYTGRVFIGYDYTSIDTTSRCVRAEYNGVEGDPVYWMPDVNAGVNENGEIYFTSGSIYAIYLPTDLLTIEDEAYYGTKLNGRVIVCWPGVTSIGDRAFQNSGIQAIYLPESVNHVGIFAFEGSDVTIYCVAGSWADKWATEEQFHVVAMNKE